MKVKFVFLAASCSVPLTYQSMVTASFSLSFPVRLKVTLPGSVTFARISGANETMLGPVLLTWTVRRWVAPKWPAESLPQMRYVTTPAFAAVWFLLQNKPEPFML